MLKDIQKNLKAPKGQVNKFGNYKYRSCEDILEAVKPLLGDATLTISDDIVNIGDRFYVKATATYKSDKEVVLVTAYAREAENKKGNDEAQITGAASSYARKYALNGLFLIDDTKDPDTQDNSDEQKRTPEQKQETVYKRALTSIGKADEQEGLKKIRDRIVAHEELTEGQKADLIEQCERRLEEINFINEIPA